MTNCKFITIAIALSVTVLVSGCGSSPEARLYLLEPVAIGGAPARPAAATVLVKEIVLAEHLARREILSRDRRYEVSTAEFDRWAEPLQNNVTAVITENLSTLLASDDVITYPWTFGEPADFTINTQILYFGPDPGGDVVLTALWRIDGLRGETVALRRTSYSQPRSTAEAVSTVAAMSRALGDLSEDIASEVRAASATRDKESR